MTDCDVLIIGAGLYGLYAALVCGRQKKNVIVLEKESGPFQRATYINQARVHMGYHYPRSYSTAVKSAGYFERFVRDFSDCILTDFDQIYATSSHFSYTDARQFKKFCASAGIFCEEVSPDAYFHPGLCDGAFRVREYTYDAGLLKKKMLDSLSEYQNVKLHFHEGVTGITQEGDAYRVSCITGAVYESPFVLNAAYASVNQLPAMLGYKTFRLKYELCEIILCRAGGRLENTGLTVMDGPFFSVMPFGKTGYHSLTSVTFTPHAASSGTLPSFACQKRCDRGFCSPDYLGNCSSCSARPGTAWAYMRSLAAKYLREEYEFRYVKSLFSMKPVLSASETDDSRPTLIRTGHSRPAFVSVLSGKINTVYDLDEVLKW